MIRKAAVLAFLGASATLSAEDFSLTVDGVGPIKFHSVLTRESKGERLIATATNASEEPIPYVRFCVTVTANQCLFEMWTTKEWKPGDSINWELTTPKHVGDLGHRVVIYGEQFEEPTQPSGPGAAAGAAPKGKSLITIQVVNTDTQRVTVPYTIAGTPGYSATSCNSTGTATGTGGIVTANGSTNCTTSGRGSTGAQTFPLSIALLTVLAIMPDGHHVALRCQNALRGCANLEAGSYNANLDGNSLTVHAHKLDGTEFKVKYRYVGGW